VDVAADGHRDAVVGAVQVQQQRDAGALDVLEQDRREPGVVGVVGDLVDDRGRLELRVDLVLDDLELLGMLGEQLVEIGAEVLWHEHGWPRCRATRWAQRAAPASGA